MRGKLVEGRRRSHQIRQVPLPRFLVGPLAEQVAGMGPDDLVFTVAGRWTATEHQLPDPGLESSCAVKPASAGLTPHDLRHTAASLAVAAGANVKAVQRMLGHASAAMTLDVYAGLFGDDLDAVADRLDEAFRPAECGLMCGLRPPATQ